MTVQSLSPDEMTQLLAAQAIEPRLPTQDFSLLHQLASLSREMVTQLLVARDCQPGEIIFREGQVGEALYIIRSGLVTIVKGDFDTPTILANRGTGEIIGEMALLEGQPRSASVIALQPTRLLRLTPQSFQKLLVAEPELARKVLRSLSARLRLADHARNQNAVSQHLLAAQISQLATEKQNLLEMQRLRQETSDFIAHDLRNPLATVISAFDLLKLVLPEDVLTANLEIIDMAAHAAERMQGLVEDFLEVARMETGEAPLKRTLTSLRELAIGVLSRAKLNTQGSVDLQVAIPETLPAVLSDQEQLERVLTNLVDNALKYTPKGGKIIIAAETSNNQVMVSVTDTGPGIPPGERELIFDRFAQTTTEKPRRRGFGLGLTFCRLTVEAHGGKIWVESGNDGVGSRFVFTLPLIPSIAENS
jgi:signal transduction histidine kinase